MLKQFWHNDITDKSLIFLKKMKSKFNFILIGGWAVYLYTKKIKSKDIDIIIDYEELGRLKTKYELIKNERLKKYEINLGEFDIDIYLPYYSKIGFPLERIGNYTQNISGYIVPRIEVLLAMKLFAYQDRKNSLKGDKDRLDIVSLLDSVDINWKLIKKIESDLIPINITELITEIINKTDKIEELGLNNQKMSKLKTSVFNSFDSLT